MTDNFTLYKQYIQDYLPQSNPHGNNDRYYVIELMRRGKDNPDLPAANMHFKNYYIYCLDDLDRYAQEVKDICTIMHMRAYASVNYKSIQQVTLDTLAETARRVAVHDFKRPYAIFESCSGKYVDKGEQRFVIDLDDCTPDSHKVTTIKEIVEQCRNDKHERKIIAQFPTRSGVHLVTHTFDLCQFRTLCGRGYGDIDIKKNHLTLLYENL